MESATKTACLRSSLEDSISLVSVHELDQTLEGCLATQCKELEKYDRR